MPGYGQQPLLNLPSLRVAEIVAALSQALDLGSGSSRWHSVRTCILGMRIADELGIPDTDRNALYYALLLKDAGCSSNASLVYHALQSDEISAKGDVKRIDWTRMNVETLRYVFKHVAAGKPWAERVRAIFKVAAEQKQHGRTVTAMRCEKGATLARLIGLPMATAAAITSLDEHWDGSGNPDGFKREEIPINSRIMLLAQTLDVFACDQGPDAALRVIRARAKRWFDPEVVRAAISRAKRNTLWNKIDSGRELAAALELEPERLTIDDGSVSMESICQAFGQIVDGKSPFTLNHSLGVANTAVSIGQGLGLPAPTIVFLHQAGLLHDLGKMAVSNQILEKPGKLDEGEWQVMRAHPEHTYQILNSITGFGQMSEVAASHHEKLNGTGYFRGLQGAQIGLEARILVVADIFDALAANRPYREAMPLERVLGILRKDCPNILDSDCVHALAESGVGCDQSYRDLEALGRQISDFESRPALQEAPAVLQ